MTSKIETGGRLHACAELVPFGSRVADIGADHGYLSIELLQSGRAAYVHACDLREKPLQKAMANALRCGVADRMRFSRADGLAAILPDEVDTIVCAGMGGDLIVQIIAACPWIRDAKYRLILQPQSSGNDLRRRLSELGFGIVQETLAKEGGFLYNILVVRYGNAAPLTPGEQYLSPQLKSSGSPLLPSYHARILRALTLTVEGLRRAAEPQEKLQYYETALKEISAIHFKEELT